MDNRELAEIRERAREQNKRQLREVRDSISFTLGLQGDQALNARQRKAYERAKSSLNRTIELYEIAAAELRRGR